MDFSEHLNEKLFENLMEMAHKPLSMELLEPVIYLLLYFFRGKNGS